MTKTLLPDFPARVLVPVLCLLLLLGLFGARPALGTGPCCPGNYTLLASTVQCVRHLVGSETKKQATAEALCSVNESATLSAPVGTVYLPQWNTSAAFALALAEMETVGVLGENEKAWLGLEQDGGGKWKYTGGPLDDKQAADNAWATGQPDASGDCVQFNFNDAWDDILCDAFAARHVICETAAMDTSQCPTFAPTPAPTQQPTDIPTRAPSALPSAAPSSEPTQAPSAMPTALPTKRPTAAPSAQPSAVPSGNPTSAPSAMPSVHPTALPTLAPSRQPTSAPTPQPTAFPTSQPTPAPTADPTAHPSGGPTWGPTAMPSLHPSQQPSPAPTSAPTARPTAFPTAQPTPAPTADPSAHPSGGPTWGPTAMPTPHPSSQPTPAPTADPSAHPSGGPTRGPSAMPTPQPSPQPTPAPTMAPTAQPTACPTAQPTSTPTSSPTAHPSGGPTIGPSALPSPQPSPQPTPLPTDLPTAVPTPLPTSAPSPAPSPQPTPAPTVLPTAAPTMWPTPAPSPVPSAFPTSLPSPGPSRNPTDMPTSAPTSMPSPAPTMLPSLAPTTAPTLHPSPIPSTAPTLLPSNSPTEYPTPQPSAPPTPAPSPQPTRSPTESPSLNPDTQRPTPDLSDTFDALVDNITESLSVAPAESDDGEGFAYSMDLTVGGTQAASACTAWREFLDQWLPYLSTRTEFTGVTLFSLTPVRTQWVECPDSTVADSFATALTDRGNASAWCTLTTNGGGDDDRTYTVLLRAWSCDGGASMVVCGDCTTATCDLRGTEEMVYDPCDTTGTTASRRLAAGDQYRISYTAISYIPSTVYPAIVSVPVQVVDAISSGFTVEATVEGVGTLYCGAWSIRDVSPDSAGDVLDYALRHSTFVTTATASPRTYQVPFSHLTGQVRYDVLCVTEASGTEADTGVSLMPLSVGETSATSMVTPCCRKVTVAMPTTPVFQDSVSDTFTISLGYPPFTVDGHGNLEVELSAFVQPSDKKSCPALAAIPANVSLVWPSPIIAPTEHTFESTNPSVVTSEFVLTPSTPGCLYLVGNLVGNSSGVYTLDAATLLANPVRVWSLEEEPAPPGVSSATFSASGAQILVKFDTDTNMAPQLSYPTPCATLISFLGVSRYICSWPDATSLRASFVSTRTGTGLPSIGDDVLLVEGVLKALCTAGSSSNDSSDSDCADWAYANSSSAVLEAPVQAVTPAVSLALPSAVLPCNDATLTLDATSSTGSGGRAWTSVSWNVSAQGATATAVAMLQNFLDDLTAEQLQSGQIVFEDAGQLTVSAVFEISLVLENFLGKSATSTKSFAVVFAPIVSIAGTSFVEVFRNTSLTLQMIISFASCDQNGTDDSANDFDYTDLDIEWQAFDSETLALVSLESSSPDAQYMEIIAYPSTLAVQRTYVISCTVTERVGGTSSSASVRVYYPRSALVSQIVGGTERSVAANSAVVLDASASFDPDEESTSHLLYRWSCKLISPSFGAPCTPFAAWVQGVDASNGGDVLSNTTITVPANTLQTGYEYRFTALVVSPEDGRTSSSTLDLVVVDSQLVDVSATIASPLVNAGDSVVLDSTLAASGAVDSSMLPLNGTAVWSVLSGALPADASSLADVTRTPVQRQFEFSEARPTRSFPLQLETSALALSSMYTFQLEIAATSAALSSTSFTQITVLINTPPSTGQLEVDPMSGVAMATLFELTALYWEDPDGHYPLTFQFEYVSPASGGQDVLLNLRASQARILRTLPSATLWTNATATELAAVVNNGSSGDDGKDTDDGVDDNNATAPGTAIATTDRQNLTVVLTVLDSLDASTDTAVPVYVAPSSNVSVAAMQALFEDHLEVAIAVGDTSLALASLTSTAVALAQVSCEQNCTWLNRSQCWEVHDVCGACSTGYVGYVGSDNSPCLLESDAATQWASVGERCSLHTECEFQRCSENDGSSRGVCLDPEQTCASGCWNNGNCSWVTSLGEVWNASANAAPCRMSDSQCSAVCSCDIGYHGDYCRYDNATYQALLSWQDSTLDALGWITGTQRVSEESVSSAASGLAQVSTAGLCNSATDSVANVSAQLAVQGLSSSVSSTTLSSLVSTASAVLGALECNSTSANGTSGSNGNSSRSSSIMVDVVNSAASSALDNQVAGSGTVSVVSTSVRVSTVVQYEDSTSNWTLSTPQTTAEEAASGSSVASATLPASGASICGSGDQSVVVTSWSSSQHGDLQASDSNLSANASSTAQSATPTLGILISSADASSVASSNAERTILLEVPFADPSVLDGITYGTVEVACADVDVSATTGWGSYLCPNGHSTVHVNCSGLNLANANVNVSCPQGDLPQCVVWNGTAYDADACTVLSYTPNNMTCSCRAMDLVCGGAGSSASSTSAARRRLYNLVHGVVPASDYALDASVRALRTSRSLGVLDGDSSTMSWGSFGRRSRNRQRSGFGRAGRSGQSRRRAPARQRTLSRHGRHETWLVGFGSGSIPSSGSATSALVGMTSMSMAEAVKHQVRERLISQRISQRERGRELDTLADEEVAGVEANEAAEVPEFSGVASAVAENFVATVVSVTELDAATVVENIVIFATIGVVLLLMTGVSALFAYQDSQETQVKQGGHGQAKQQQKAAEIVSMSARPGAEQTTAWLSLVLAQQQEEHERREELERAKKGAAPVSRLKRRVTGVSALAAAEAPAVPSPASSGASKGMSLNENSSIKDVAIAHLNASSEDAFSQPALTKLWEALKTEHDVVSMFYTNEANPVPRYLKAVVVLSWMLSLMFGDALFYVVMYPDTGPCTSYTSQAMCLEDTLPYDSSTQTCEWDTTEKECSFNEEGVNPVMQVWGSVFGNVLAIPLTAIIATLVVYVLAKPTRVPQTDSAGGDEEMATEASAEETAGSEIGGGGLDDNTTVIPPPCELEDQEEELARCVRAMELYRAQLAMATMPKLSGVEFRDAAMYGLLLTSYDRHWHIDRATGRVEQGSTLQRCLHRDPRSRLQQQIIQSREQAAEYLEKIRTLSPEEQNVALWCIFLLERSSFMRRVILERHILVDVLDQKEQKKERGVPLWVKGLAAAFIVAFNAFIALYVCLFAISIGPEQANLWLLAYMMSFTQENLIFAPMGLAIIAIAFPSLVQRDLLWTVVAAYEQALETYQTVDRMQGAALRAVTGRARAVKRFRRVQASKRALHRTVAEPFADDDASSLGSSTVAADDRVGLAHRSPVPLVALAEENVQSLAQLERRDSGEFLGSDGADEKGDEDEEETKRRLEDVHLGRGYEDLDEVEDGDVDVDEDDAEQQQALAFTVFNSQEFVSTAQLLAESLPELPASDLIASASSPLPIGQTADESVKHMNESPSALGRIMMFALIGLAVFVAVAPKELEQGALKGIVGLLWGAILTMFLLLASLPWFVLLFLALGLAGFAYAMLQSPPKPATDVEFELQYLENRPMFGLTKQKLRPDEEDGDQAGDADGGTDWAATQAPPPSEHAEAGAGEGEAGHKARVSWFGVQHDILLTSMADVASAHDHLPHEPLAGTGDQDMVAATDNPAVDGAGNGLYDVHEVTFAERVAMGQERAQDRNQAYDDFQNRGDSDGEGDEGALADYDYSGDEDDRSEILCAANTNIEGLDSACTNATQQSTHERQQRQPKQPRQRRRLRRPGAARTAGGGQQQHHMRVMGRIVSMSDPSTISPWDDGGVGVADEDGIEL